MKFSLFAFVVLSAVIFNSCTKSSSFKEDAQTTTETETNLSAERRALDGKNYRLRNVEMHVFDPFDPQSTTYIYPEYSAGGPAFRITSLKSQAQRENKPGIWWDARINYNSDKIVFISNQDNIDEEGVFLPLVLANDTIVFAALKNGRIDYSRAGKLNGYYSKMQYYYNAKGQLSRMVNWSNVAFYGYRVFDFRFSYDSYGNLLSWKDVSSHNIGGVTHTYDYSRPVKNAYYKENRGFIEPVFTIMEQFGLFESMMPKHLRTSTAITSYYYPQNIHIDYPSADQIIDAAGNLIEYSTWAGDAIKVSWASY